MGIRAVPRERRVALLVAGCFFMEMLDGTIVTTAAPSIGRSLAVPSTSISLVISAYLVTLAVLIPASGWMAARFGARPVFLAAIVVFTLASIGCAASTRLPELVAMRIVQGAGGALMVPVGRQVVLADTPKEELMPMMSFLVWPALVAPVFAPLLGGRDHRLRQLALDLPDQRAARRGRLRGGAAADLLAAGRPPPRLDRLGVLLTCVGLGGLTYAADLLAQPRAALGRWPSALGAVAAACLFAAIRHLLGTESR